MPAEDAPSIDAELASIVGEGFARGSGHGLLRLGGAAAAGGAWPPAFRFWRDFGARFLTALCTRPDDEPKRQVPAPDAEILEALAAEVPPMPGAEYVDAELLRALWAELGRAVDEELAASGGTVAELLRALDPAWSAVGRVHFNLAENRRDEAAPFAFLASYATRLSAHGKAQHAPLAQVARESAGSERNQRLLSVFVPVQRAAERCDWLRELVRSGGIFHPLRWSADDALRLLHDVPELERAGIVVRMPATWKAGRPPRPRVAAVTGRAAPSGLGVEALLDFDMEVTLDGQPLSRGELEELLAGSGGLALIRGRWVEVDRERLERTIARFDEARRLAKKGGLTFAEATRLLAGAGIADADDDRVDRDWSEVVAGPWLAETLRSLRSPEALASLDAGLGGTLRPYQEVGLRWLHTLGRLGLGACLADDMGLGKTLQVLALLRLERKARRGPSLLVAPASLLANWAGEMARFTPELSAMIVHPSVARKGRDGPGDADLVITSYGTLQRTAWLGETDWNLVVLDEAQAIKNPEAKQTRAAKRLKARARIALTGTPVENRLSDLWSIFDFLNPGLLGSARQFGAYARRLSDGDGSYRPLRELVRPYILRRLKTDRRVIADLPDKTEVKAYCSLGRRQAALYQEAVDDLAGKLGSADGIQRRGLVLAALMRMKQICNHPSHWLGDGSWAPDESGKLARLGEIAETIAARQDKVLVFTQFREIVAPLAAYLGGVFGRPGLVLHGDTDVKKRPELVRRFQENESIPFFVLSLKAGGTGLNLTAASHVIHFDRWWNPAVENQATDRAFRIGQKQNVLVHKFVCRGTVEERIDALIESKKRLAGELLEGGGEINLTELGDAEILKLVALDLDAAMKE